MLSLADGLSKLSRQELENVWKSFDNRKNLGEALRFISDRLVQLSKDL